jgi:hypothetical protein
MPDTPTACRHAIAVIVLVLLLPAVLAPGAFRRWRERRRVRKMTRRYHQGERG